MSPVRIGTGAANVDVSALRVAGQSVSKVMLGTGTDAVKVWPVGARWVETFDTARASGWNTFVAGSLGQARQASGRAALVSIGMNASSLAYGMYASPTNTGEQYLDVELALPPTGTLDTGGAGAPLYLRLRGASTVWASGVGVEAMLRGSGAVSIASFSGTTVTTRASGSGSFAAGDTIRFEAQGNVYRLRNLTRGTTLLTWIDSTNIVPTSQRYAGMTQSGNYPVFQAYYQCYAVNRWELGDL